ncbi:MAG: hypothetical protein H7Y86_05400 [Rhizobacter sp.]|nr:hypothetical protein [Ferruginibacter sp.]
MPFLLCSCSSSKITTTKFADNSVVAHRGAFKKNALPENSIAALKEAIRLGCTGSEFDIRLTANDSLIINHDAHYNKLEIEKTEWIKEAKENNIALNAWTINKKEDMEWLLKEGFNFITTNEPELLFSVLNLEK